MKQKKYTIAATLLFCMALLTVNFTACSVDEMPVNPAPTLTASEAANITRIQATISGTITGNVENIEKYGFLYATSEGDLELEKNATDIPMTTALNGTLSTTISNLEIGQQYFYRLYAKNSVTKVFSPIKSFQTKTASDPTLSEVTLVEVDGNTMTLSCKVLDNGGTDIIDMGIEYSEIGSDEVYKRSAKAFDAGSSNTFTVTIRNLSADTDYEVRGYADRGRSETLQVKTTAQYAPIMTTLEIGYVGTDYVVAAGAVTDQGASEVLEKGFCYSTTNQTPSIVDSHIAVEGEESTFHTTISGLEPNTTYYLCAYGMNKADGKTRYGYGDVVTFTTASFSAPEVSKTTVENITFTTADLSAEIISTGNGIIIEKGFCYSKSNSTPDLTTNFIPSTGEGNALAVTLEQLEPDTRYYVRAYVKNQNEAEGKVAESYGEVVEFTTNAYTLPQFSDLTATDITETSAKLHVVVSTTDVPIIEKGFCWGTAATPTVDGNKKVVEGDGFETTVSEFASNTTYYFRAYITYQMGNGSETVYSSDANFTTKKGYTLPQFSDLTATDITETSARLNAIVSNTDVPIIEKGFCWGTAATPTVDGNKKVVEGDGFETTVSEFTSNTTYYFRAYITYQIENNIETIYSSDATFTTTATVVASKEREALIAFYQATGGDNWINNTNWCTDEPLSTWYGVSVMSITDDMHTTIPNGDYVTKIDLRNNGLTGSATFEDFSQLNYLDVSENQLTSLEVSNCSYMHYLYCFNNQLTSLNVSNLPGLRYLLCDYNQLASLDLSQNLSTTLPDNHCVYSLSNNQLTTLDVSSLVNLTSFDCSNNQLSSLDVSSCKNLTSLYCFENEISSLNVSNLVNLNDMNCDNNKLVSLNISDCVNLTWLRCGSNQISSLDVSNNSYIENLICSINQLTSLDVSNLVNLTELVCGDNQLTSLDVSNCVNLTSFYCHSNQLTSLDVLACSDLTELFCMGNNLYQIRCLKELLDSGKISYTEWQETDTNGNINYYPIFVHE